MSNTSIHSALGALGLIFLLNSAYSQSVNLGNPPVINFAKQKTKAGTQFWDISQDSNGVCWFANNSGLLEFDGTHWRLYPMDNGTIVRSVRATKDQQIFVGAQGDFGCFSPDAKGNLKYRSFKNLSAATDQNFADVWDIEISNGDAFFRTDNYVFRYHEGQISAWQPPCKSLFFMGKWRDQLLVQDGAQLLYVFENGHFKPLDNPGFFSQGRISALLPLGADTMLITTIQNGIFYNFGNTVAPWVTQDDAFLKTNRIFCAERLPDDKIAIGSSLNGLVTLDKHRRIVNHVNKKSGLQNNTVLSLLALKNGSVWLGLDNGVDYVDLRAPFSTFYPDGDLQGTGYCAQIYQGKIYFGTNTGLFALDWKNYYKPSEQQAFSLVNNAQGQVWSLNKIGNQLLMGHHEGAFEINGLQARMLTRQPGMWKFLEYSPELTIAGHYNGLATFKRSPAGWVFDSVKKGFSESSRILALDADGAIWMAHPYRGIFRLRLGPNAEEMHADFFNEAQGLPSALGNHLFQLGNKIVFTGKTGVFDFDAAQKRFIPNPKFTQLFGEKTSVKYLMQDEYSNIWYETDAETGVLLVENEALEKKIRRVPIPELKDKLTGGFPFILPVDRQNVFIATGQGFIHFNLAKYATLDSNLQLVLHEVRLKNGADSLLFGGQVPPSGLSKCELNSKQNALVFSFSSPDYPGAEYVEYAHVLKGLERNWSDWNRETDLSYGHLSPGDYTFQVKARNQHGIESAVLSFEFTILPPWYASQIAYILYSLLIVGFVMSIIYRQRQNFEKEKKNLQDLHQHREEQHQLHVLRSEEAINQLKNEKLEAEIHHKTQELASIAMHLVQKNTIINAIQEALNKLQTRKSNPGEVEKEISRIIKMLEHDASLEEDWEHFSRNFDSVHSDFLKRLGEHFGKLSPNDYKLCAYLRMNLSSKEIASLMNISVRGVEASRYRLRKRLGLDTEANLTEFLMRF